MVSLPKQFEENMRQLLQQDYQAYLDSFSSGRSYGLRVNTSKISVEEFLKIAPFHLEPVPWCENGFYYLESERPGKHPYYYAGLYYLQEPSAMLPAEILPVDEGDVVLDGCGAPGGKSTQLALKLKGSGVLVSNDISASRCQGLLKNLELFGTANAVVCSEDLNNLAAKYPAVFDKILIDAPCSGEGMFRKDSSLITSWQKRGNDYYSEIQRGIVKSALQMLKPGGKMVYSTCTFSPQEDEEILEYMFSACPQLQLLDIPMAEGFCQGLPGFEKAVRLYPHKIKGEGHFVALLQKGQKEAADAPEQTIKTVDLKEIDGFFELVDTNRFQGDVTTIKDKVIINTSFETKGLRVLRNGLLLGKYNKAHVFEPSQALALALRKEEFKQVIDLKGSDERVIRYLKGETIDVSQFNYQGWVLVCVDGFPLGFGKINQGLFKNKYDKNYRYV